MPVYEITAPDGRTLEIEGEKMPTEAELNNIFNKIPATEQTVSVNQSALNSIKSAEDEPSIGNLVAERFNKLKTDALQYTANVPKQEKGMSWIEYAMLRKKYDEDWGLQTPELNPLKSFWKDNIFIKTNEILYKGQKEKRAKEYTDNKEVLSQIPQTAINDWDKKGNIKAGEALMRSDWSKAIPFLGSAVGLDETFDIKSIIDKKNRGEILSRKETERLNAYILDIAEQNYRGISFGGKLVQGALELPAFAGEFIATGGIAAIGKTAMKKTITKSLQDAAKNEIGKRLTKGVIEGAAGAVTRTSLGMPQRVAENYGMRKLQDSLGITDKGQVILETADKAPFKTFLKAWGDTVIECWSEEMGGGLSQAASIAGNKLLSPLANKLFSRDTRAAFIKAMRKIKPNAKVKDIMTRTGFNGILEEMGEERAGDVLRAVFGIDDRQDVSTFEKLCDAINPGAEELLLELGLFSIPGSMSFAASRVANYLRSRNIEENTISDYLKYSSELEKEQLLGDIADNRNFTDIKNLESQIKDLKNRYFTQNLNAGLEKEEALSAADIQANAIASLAKNIGMDINELNNEFAINTQSLSTEQAKEQQRKDALMLQGGVEMNVERHNQPLYQSAMKKSHFDNFTDFYKDVLSKPKNAKNKEQFNVQTKDGLNIRIPHDTIVHDNNRHKLSVNEWEDLLNNIDDVSYAAISKKKSRFDGTSVLLKIDTANNSFGVVLETFSKNNPLISTAFIDTEQNIDNWIKNEAVPSGTKTSFLSISLNNIITSIHPDFKTKLINKKLADVFSTAHHGTSTSSKSIIAKLINDFNPNNNIYYQSDSIKPIELQKDSVPNFEKVADLKNWIEENLNLLGDVQIKSNNRTVHFSKSNIGRSMKGINRNSTKRNSYAILKELVENSVYGYKKKPDERHSKRNNGQEIYHNAFIYDGEIYGIEISIDIPKNAKTTHSYAGHKIKIIKKAPEVNGTKLPDLTDANISINDIRAIFNPDVKVYYQSDSIDNARGFTYQRFNFDGTTKDNLIVLLKNKSDKSTLLHEFAHVYLTTLNNLALRNDRAKELLVNVNKWLNYNGVEYTRQQHEKFANGFVAYVRSGKAPTYGLKRAFENFKRWLNDLYTNLSLSDDIELDKETQKVFDELLGDKSIKSKEAKIAEIIKKAKENATLRLSYEYAEKRQIQPFHLTEKQRRYRDTAYDIVYYALANSKDENGQPLVKDKRELYMLFGNDSAYNKKNKGIKHRKEKLEQYLLETEDVFSGGDGFLPEWGEFFYNPGVDNGSNEIGANAQLARQAFEVITEKRYLYDTNSYDRTGFTDEDVKKTQYELDYIIEQYKTAKEKDLPMAAFFEWIDNVHPYIQEDIITQWEAKTNEIDRYASLTEFQKAKEDLKLYAATLKGYGDYSWQFAQYARKILKRLDFMTEMDKAKIFDKLKDYNSFSEVEQHLDEIMDYAETLNDVSLRRNLADTILNEIKRTTPEIVKGTKKTRYDYQTNKLFERLREINRMKQEEVKDLYDAYVNEEMERREKQFEQNGTITGKTEDYFEDIENSIIQFKANGVYYNSTEALQTLLDKIQNAKFTGKVARDEMDFERRMKQENLINQCAKALETHRGEAGILEKLYSMEANFDSMLSMLFDDNIKNEFSLDDLYAQVDGRVGKDREEVLNKIADVFGFEGIGKGFKLNSKFIEMANDKYKIRQRYAKKYETDDLGVWGWEEIELSRMEILYYYIQAKNPVSYQMLTDMGDETRAAKGQFDKYEFDELINNLTDQEKLMGDILQLAAEKYYNELNKYHIKKHHIDMGKVTCYFPRKSELSEVNELDLFNQYTQKSTNPGFVKIRSAGPSVRIAPANPVNVLFNHIQKANTIIIMGEKLDLINKVFRDNDLKQKIKSVYGDVAYREFMQHVTENLYNGQTKTLSQAEGIISKLMSNIIVSPMLIKPQIGIKQVMGLINYGIGDEYVGTIEWMKAFGDVIKHPKAAIDFMMQDEYLKDRLTRANLNEAMKNQIDQKLFSKLSLLTDYFSLNMRLGDMLNLTLGGKAYVDVLLKKGFTKEQAFELFRKKTISDQQSSISSTLSNMQRNSQNNPFARLLFAYQNTPHQYFRICANAVIKAKHGKISKTRAVKTMFIYWWLLPFIFNMAGSLSPILYLTTGDDDEIINDMLLACLGPVSCIPFFGEMARAAFAGATGQEYFGNKDWFTRANEAIIKPLQKVRKGELEFGDILKSLEVFAMALGIPLEELATQLEAIGDYAQGDIAKGFLKNIGYSRYRAKLLTGEE